MNNNCINQFFNNSCKHRCCNCTPVIGPTGPQGEAATIVVGSTTSLPPGSAPTVTNTGTNTNAILNFQIPTSLSINSGNFISRISTTYTSPNSIISLPITLNSSGIAINTNSVVSIPKSGRYLISYGITSTTIDNIVGIYINGINNQNTNLRTIQNSTNISSSIILNLNQNDIITLGTTNATTTNPLTLEENTINAYITIINLD